MSRYEFAANQIPLDDELPPDEPHPVTHDLDADVNMVDPGFANIARPVNPSDFIRPDGSYDVSPLNVGDRGHVESVNNYQRRLRDATPSPVFPTRGGVEQ